LKTDNVFNIRRFWLLLKNDILSNYRSFLISVGAVFGVLLLINVSSVGSADEWNFHEVFFPLTLFIGGFIATSRAFNDLHHKQKSYAYVTLPASRFEKLLSKLLVTTIGYTLATAMLYYLFSVIAIVVTLPFFSMHHAAFNPFDPLILKIVAIYLITQSVFLFGALYFKSYNFIKTILTLYGINILLALFSLLVARICFGNLFAHPPMDFMAFESLRFQAFLAKSGDILLIVVKVIFWGLMAPFFWILSYLRLSETEV